MQLKSTNPALSDIVFDREADRIRPTDTAMTLPGTVAKTGVLLLLLIGVAVVCGWWTSGFLGSPEGTPWGVWAIHIGAMIGAIIVAIVTTISPRRAPFTAPLYAVLEGWVLGGISVLFAQQSAGLVVLAVALTVGVLAVLLFVYATRLIRPTENLKLGIAAATGGLALVYAISFVLSLFGVKVPFIDDFGIVGILFSLFAVTVAAFNLVLHFDFIETGVKRAAPKYMEWYAGFGLLVTLVWLYIEILKLLSKLQQRNRS